MIYNINGIYLTIQDDKIVRLTNSTTKTFKAEFDFRDKLVHIIIIAPKTLEEIPFAVYRRDQTMVSISEIKN